MIQVLLVWADMLLTTIPLGASFLFFSIDKKDRTLIIPEDILVCGLMLATVYAQYFSLFAPVSLLAHIFLYLINILLLIFVIKKGGFNEFVKSLSFSFSRRRLLKIIFLIFSVILFAFGTSRGYMHYDSDLYHAQAIRWIEEYGVVKGLGNLHGRLAYNSSSFALSALYSFAFLGGRSLHACAGFLALIVFVDSFRFVHIFSDKNVRVSDFARIAALYYVFNIYDEMVSPASDFFAMLLFIYAVVRLTDIADIHCPDMWAFFTMVCVFLATVKFSTAGMLLICILPIVSYVRIKRFPKLVLYTASGFFIALPYFIRNYLLSGWLLYPSTAIDIFFPKWKVPKFYADVDSAYIIAFGRGFSFMDASKLGFGEWFSHWFSILGTTEKILVAGSFTSLAVFIVCFFSDRKNNGLLLAEFSVILTFLLWLFSSPLIRYGQGIILMLPFVMFGHFFCHLSDKFSGGTRGIKLLNTVVPVLYGLFIIYKGIALSGYIISQLPYPYYVHQLDYGLYETSAYEVGGTVFYASDDGDRTGYDPFPSSPERNYFFALLGDDIGDGFICTYIP